MENKNNETIRVEIDEEIISIVNKLRQCEKNEITLLVPSSALLLQSVVNLKILKRKASELRKNISIITIDENDENIENSKMSETKSKTADNAPESVSSAVVDNQISASDNFKDDREPDKNTDIENSAMRKKRVKMFDIVRKVNKTDDGKKETKADMENKDMKQRYFHHYNFPPFSVGEAR